MHSIAKNFSSSLEENHFHQAQQSYSQDTGNQQSYSGVSSGIASLLAVLVPNGQSNTEEEDNALKHRKKKSQKRYYGRQF